MRLESESSPSPESESYKSVNNFIETVGEINWKNTLPQSHDINVIYNSFLTHFSAAYNKSFPAVIKTIKVLSNGYKPWITSGILRSIKRKNNLYKTWLHKRTDEAHQNYKLYKNKLTSLIRTSERMYFREKFFESKNDIKRTWKIIKTAIGNHQANECIKELNINGNLVGNRETIANKMNDYFIDVGPDLAKKIPPVTGDYRDYLTNASQNMFLLPTDSSEVKTIVDELNSNKATGSDDIPPKIVKLVIPYIAQPLSEIFNVSLFTGIFPDNMKLAKVTPIFKSDDRAMPNNYRPISVLPVFSKILEKIMHKRLSTYLTKFDLLTHNQYGFRENHSTYMALINLIDRISEEIENNHVTLGIFIDLSKAFDTINHKILIDKLNAYGIRGTANDWFKSYISNRQQFVQIGDTKSKILPIRCGVPQGSILGPLLFIIYINDITKVSKLFDLIMFADDTNLFIKDNDIHSLISKANTELEKISKWFKLNKLSLNIKKTNFILFKNKRKAQNVPLELKIDNTRIEQIKKTKFLGVIVNETLTWDDHIKTVKQKVQKNIGIIFRIRHILPFSTLRSLYFTLIHPYLEYCNIIWAISRSSLLNNLFLCQKKAIRVITNSKANAHTKPLFNKLRILTIFDVNNLQIGCFMYRCMYSLLPPYFCAMFAKNSTVHAYNTRQHDLLHIFGHKTNVRRHTAFIFGPKIWNKLPAAIVQSTNIFKFKKQYKHHLLQNPTFTIS